MISNMAPALIAHGAQRLAGAFELMAYQARIETVAGQEFGVASGFDQAAVIENRQQISVAHCR